MNSPNESHQRKLGLTIFLLGAICLTLAHRLVPSDTRWEILLPLTLVCLYGEWRSVKLPGFGFLNPGEGFYLATACLFGPVPGSLMAFFTGLVGDLRKGKSIPVLVFNMGWALTTFSAVAVVYTKFGLVGAGLTYILVAGTLQAHGENAFRGLPLSQTYRRQAREMMLVGPAVCFFAYLTLLLAAIRLEAIFLLLLPLELVVTYVRTRELSQDLGRTLRELEQTQAELVATGRKAALGVMAAGIAHEINNPLAAAVTNIHMLKMVNREQALKPSIELLEKSVTRCQTIVGRMLKYSRSSGEGGVPCNLAETVEDALLFCGREFGSDKTQFQSDLKQTPEVMADPTELVQILANLLSNAHDSGATRVTLGSRTEADSVAVVIEDDGSGIAPELQEKIFDPFFTTKAVGSGTGLGLAIAQGLARSHGGDLKLVESAPGRTRFELRLPQSTLNPNRF